MLVGHSYAGMVITGVAAKMPKRLRHLIYLDSYLPLEGESEIELRPPDQQERYRTDLDSGITLRQIPLALLGITDPKMSQWVQERLIPHPYSTYEDPPPSGAPESEFIPRTYIHCTLPPLAPWIKPFVTRARKPGWNMVTLETGHDVMITHPNDLAGILLRIACS